MTTLRQGVRPPHLQGLLASDHNVIDEANDQPKHRFQPLRDESKTRPPLSLQFHRCARQRSCW